MVFDFEDNLIGEVFSEINVFLDRNTIEDIDISMSENDFNYVSLKLPIGVEFDPDNFLEAIENKFQHKYFIITTFIHYLESPELKKYFIPYARLNEFFYYINDPEIDEKIISISQLEENQ
jgi:hypothetical protein